MTLFIATAVLHSLWLAPAAAAVSASFLATGVRNPSWRYSVSCASFFAAPLAALVIAAQGGGAGSELVAVTPFIGEWHRWIAAAWTIGTSVEAVRVAIGVRQVIALRRTSLPLDAALAASFEELRRRAGVKTVELRATIENLAPMTIGLFRPMVLLPLSLIARLPVDQLEGIVLHELAHLRRYDRWVNALQVAIETLFFFNPILRWHSERLRHEREVCCDAVAAECAGDVLTYARALAGTACLIAPGSTAMAATGGDLVARIEHLAGEPPARPWRAAAMLTLAAALTFAATGDRPAAIRRAIASLGDERWYVREAALHELRAVDSEASTAGVILALDDANWAIRSEAIDILVARGDPAAIPALRRRLRDPNWAIREKAALALDALQR